MDCVFAEYVNPESVFVLVVSVGCEISEVGASRDTEALEDSAELDS